MQYQIVKTSLNPLTGFENYIQHIPINQDKIQQEIEISNNELNSEIQKKNELSNEKTESFDSQKRYQKVRKIKGRGRIQEMRKDKKKESRKNDSQYRLKNQNVRRNLFSNIAHHYISFLKKKYLSFPTIKRIIQIQKLDITAEQFFDLMAEVKLNNYVRPQIVYNLWKGNYQEKVIQKRQQFGKIFRIAAFHFLNHDCFNSVQLSRKIRFSLKQEHWEKRRELLKILELSN